MFRVIRLCAAILFLTADLLFGYDYLTVQDPHNTWKYGQGTIEESVISIRPMGLYMEYGVYLTFSARGNYAFAATDTVEVQFSFDLPQNAIVHDLWLWIDQDIIRASILDQWTASSIYEGIVKRKRDPAILMKTGPGSYSLRVYPMAGNQTRRIKLTYLVPCQWLPSMVTSPLPMNLLKASYYKPKLSILYWPDSRWNNPRLLEYPGAAFKAYDDQQFSKYMTVSVPQEAVNSGVNFALDTPMKNGVYLSRYESNGEGFYQLAYLPSLALDIQPAKKTAVLIDFDAGKSNNQLNQVIQNVKDALHANFTSRDSFNIIYSQELTIKRASSNWIAADSAEIEKYFSQLTTNSITLYSNLINLLNNGVSFIKENGNDASILLVTDSDQVGEYQSANQLITDLLKKMSPYLPINIADFQSAAFTLHNIGGRYYYGNEYFYENISRLTNGTYRNTRSGNLSLMDILSSVLQTMSGFIGSFDLSTTLQDGYCFGRFNITPVDPTVYLNRPILQAGKYKGSFPFIVQASGVYKNQVFSNKVSLEASETTKADTLLEEVWAGNYIKSLESLTPTNNTIRQIVDFSTKSRVLSLYSAFLALEPNDTVKACKDCLDETQFTGVEKSKEFKSDTLKVQAFPNPFNSQTVIRVRLPQLNDAKNISMKIYNMLGETVRTFELSAPENSRTIQLNWNGRDDNGQNVSSGIYFFIMTTNTTRHSVKLLLLK